MRNLYHEYGCQYVKIKPNDKKDCRQCHGSGYRDRYRENQCTQCNGHGLLWDNGTGYAFKMYTLESVYN